MPPASSFPLDNCICNSSLNTLFFFIISSAEKTVSILTALTTNLGTFSASISRTCSKFLLPPTNAQSTSRSGSSCVASPFRTCTLVRPHSFMFSVAARTASSLLSIAYTRFARRAALIDTEPLPQPISTNTSAGLILSLDKATAITSGCVGVPVGYIIGLNKFSCV